jgi:hypothetical protein
MEQTNWRCVRQKVGKVLGNAVIAEVGPGTQVSDFPTSQALGRGAVSNYITRQTLTNLLSAIPS